MIITKKMVNIGKSKGIIIDKPILNRLNLSDNWIQVDIMKSNTYTEKKRECAKKV